MQTLMIKDQCYLRGAGPAYVKPIQKALRVKNPDFQAAIRQGRNTWYIPEWLCLAEMHGDNVLTFPREARGLVMKLLDSAEVEVQDQRLKLPAVSFDAQTVEMRDYQGTAINVICRTGCGVIEVPCGGGKTNIAQGAIQRIAQPTLWLTHKKDLLEQSMERCQMLLNVQRDEIGTITEGKIKAGTRDKIVFATVQSMARLSDADLGELGLMFGLIVVDECHHVFSTPHQITQFARVISHMPAYYRIGITATAKRADGLDRTMNWLLGPTVYSLPHEALESRGYIVVPEVRRVSTFWEYQQADARLDWADLLQQMTTDDDRNRVVIEMVMKHAATSHVLLLTARVGHAGDLQRWIPGAELVYGDTQMRERERIYAAVRSGACRVLVATYELAKEGLDMPVLDTLVLATPVRNATMVEQACGRVMRAMEGKAGALVIDFYDRKVRALRSQWHERKKVYQKLRCQIEEG